MSPTPGIAALMAAALVAGIAIYFAFDDGAEPKQTVTVQRVIDGDTFTARDDSGKDLGRVRVLGIDTPELAHDGQPGECYAQTATTAAKQLLDGQSVQISYDPTQEREDVYGRLLVYVDVDGTDYAQTMIAEGQARIYDSRSQPLARAGSYDEAAAGAKDSGVGLWGSAHDALDAGRLLPLDHAPS